MSDAACWLCNNVSSLRNSHIIPRFVFKWLIDSGGTPYLRKGSSPNKRVQDGDKHILYCGACEIRLSIWENKAKSHLFVPATKKQSLPINYGPWLSRFAASLSIRTLHSQKFRSVPMEFSETTLFQIDNAESHLRDFLNGRSTSPRKFTQFVFYTGYFDSYDAENLPSNWNTWINRSVERDLILLKAKI